MTAVADEHQTTGTLLDEVHINDQTVNEESPAPFVGFGSSGNGGHFGGAANLEVFTEWQWLTTRERAITFPF